MSKGSKRRHLESGIYVIQRIDSDQRYIGSAVCIDNRWRAHLHALRNGKHRSNWLQNVWNKHGESAFEFAVLETVENLDLLLEREQVWLDHFKPCYNTLKVAGSPLGFKHSPETIAKLRGNKNCVGHKQTPEARANSGAALRGIKRTPEQRARMAEVSRQRRHSAETRAKISAVTKGRKRPPRTEAHKEALRQAALAANARKRSQASE
jgi:group I intron endonuclease